MGSHYTDHCHKCFRQLELGESCCDTKHQSHASKGWHSIPKIDLDKENNSFQMLMDREIQARVSSKKAATIAKKKKEHDTRIKKLIRDSQEAIRADKHLTSEMASELLKEIRRLRKEVK